MESWKVKNKKLNFSYGYMLINFILFFFPVIMNLFLMDGKVDLFREGDDGKEEGNEDENLLWRLLDQDNKKKV